MPHKDTELYWEILRKKPLTTLTTQTNGISPHDIVKKITS
jgi:hypothetical protein